MKQYFYLLMILLAGMNISSCTEKKGTTFADALDPSNMDTTVLPGKSFYQYATGAVAYSGYAEPVADGLFEIVLTGEDTAQLPVGSNTIEAIVLPTLVASATFDAHTFVTLP